MSLALLLSLAGVLVVSTVAAFARRRRRNALVPYTPVATALQWIDAPPPLNAIGATANSRAIVVDQRGAAFAGGPTVTYTSSDTSKVTVNASGVCTAVANGPSTITASATGLTSISQTATVSQTVASITGVSNTLSTDDASSGTFSPSGLDATGHAVAGATFAYAVDYASILSVNATSGAWAGQSAGTAHVTITASPGGATFIVTTTVTHAATGAPGAPTAANATAQTASSLTFPVTLNASGALPTQLAWRYSTDNATWTNGSEITLTSPSLGQNLSETVSVPSASTLYYVQFAEKNGSGTSAWCASATGTTSATSGFNASQMDPVNTTTGAGILGTNPSALPIFWDTPTLYDSDTGGAKPWRAQFSSWIGGTGPASPNNSWDVNGCRYSDAVNPNDVRWVATPDATYGPSGWSGPCFEFTFPPNNAAGTMGEHGCIQVKFGTKRPSSLWASRIVAFQSTPRWTGVGDADNTYWGQVWNNGGTLTSAFTITPAITTTGVQTVATSPNYFTSQCGHATVVIEPGGANQETLTFDGNASPAAGGFTQGADTGHLIINPTKTHSAGAVCNVTFTVGQGPGWKEGPAATFVEGGDARMETTNWGNTTVGGTTPGGQYVGQILPGGGSNTGVTENYSYGNTDATYNDGTLCQVVVRFEHWQRASDSTYWTAETYWRRILGTSTFTRIGRRVVKQASFSSLAHFYLLNWTALNMNHAFKTTQKYWARQVSYWDLDNPNADGSDDPFYLKAYEASLMPENAGGLSVSNVTSTGMTLTVINPGRFTGKFRAKVDGVWVTGQDYTMQREDGEITVTTGSNALTSVTFTLTGLSLANGDHPVEVHAISGDGTQIEPTGVSNTATVGTSSSGFVNSSSIDAGTGYTGGTYSVPAFNATTGNLLLAYVESDSSGSQNISVTDNAGNTYTRIAPIFNGHTHCDMYYAKNITGNAALVVSVTDTLADSNAFKLTVMQYTGFNTVTPLDGSTTGSGAAGSATTGTLAPTTSADTIVGFAKATSGTLVTPSGWASRSARGGFDKKLSAATPTSVTVTSTDGTATVLVGLVALKV